ncbi:MAG TPA: type II secretion system F family protein [Armatimonadota bacterium]|nr:type II secretion system F family protein [Armatimonadota bacterium]
MPLFQLETRNEAGQVQTRRVAAESQVAAVRMLRARGEFVVRGQRVTRRRMGDPLRSLRAAVWPIGPRALALLFAQLADLIRAGFSTANALEHLAGQTTERRLASFCREAAADVARGIPLSEAMALRPDLFESWVSASVAVGEQTGRLDVMASLLEQEFRTQTQFGRRFTVAAIYTRAILVFAVLAATSPAVIHVGLSGWLVSLAEIGGLAYVGWKFLHIISRFAWPRALLAGLSRFVPVCGSLRGSLSRLRAQRALRELIRAGIDPPSAFEFAAPVSGGGSSGRGLRRGADVLRAGGSFGRAYRATGLFGQREAGLMETAEETGELDSMIDETVQSLEDSADHAALRATYWGWGLLILVSVAVTVLAIYLGTSGYVNALLEWFDDMMEGI